MSLANTIALCTIAQIKTALRMAQADVSRDTELEGLALAAAAAVNSYCGRTFKRQVARVEKMAGYGTPTLLPVLCPIESLTSCTIFGWGTAFGTTIDVADLEIEDEVIVRWRAGIFPHTAYFDGGIDQGPRAGFERKDITLTYTGGYVLPNDNTAIVSPIQACPMDLQLAAASWAAYIDRQMARDLNVSAESVGRASVQFSPNAGGGGVVGGAGAAPAFLQLMLAPYKRAV